MYFFALLKERELRYVKSNKIKQFIMFTFLLLEEKMNTTLMFVC